MNGGHGKPRWKTLMISNDVIYVQVKGGKYDNVEGISNPKVDDCLCEVHHVWWCFDLVPTTYKRSQLKQGTKDVTYGMGRPLV